MLDTDRYQAMRTCAGLGWTSPDWVGAILAASGLGLALLSGALDRPVPAVTSRDMLAPRARRSMC
jgi:hypothetical protein